MDIDPTSYKNFFFLYNKAIFADVAVILNFTVLTFVRRSKLVNALL